MKILIAEDEQRAREGLQALIGTLPGDYEVMATASNGQKALELIQLLKPDVVFTDIRMPYMDGLDLVRAVRAQHLTASFVILTAYAEFELAQQSISLGVSEYLLKPVTREKVEEVLQRLADSSNHREKYTWEKSRNLRARYPDAHPLVLRALDYIENNYASKVNQKDLATTLEISPEYLSYLFSRDIGENFAHFLRNYRVEIAKRLYLSGSYDRKEVPYAVGFSDEKYFYKVFRETVGMSVADFLRG